MHAICSTRHVIASGGVTISPSFSKVVLETNQSDEKIAVSITNNDTVAASYKLSVIDFKSLSDSGGIAFLGLDGPDLQYKYGLASWVQLEKDSIYLLPSETQEVVVTIVNKESLSAGGHYGALLVEQVSPNGQEKVGLSAVPSALFLVSKLGGEIMSLELEDIEHNGSFWSMPNVVGVRFQNTGNTHLTPRGTVTIKDLFGRVVGTSVINEDSSVILPESIRLIPQYTSAKNQVLFPGPYHIEVSYRFDGLDQKSTVSKGYLMAGNKLVLAGLATGILLVTGAISKMIFIKFSKKKFILIRR